LDTWLDQAQGKLRLEMDKGGKSKAEMQVLDMGKDVWSTSMREAARAGKGSGIQLLDDLFTLDWSLINKFYQNYRIKGLQGRTGPKKHCWSDHRYMITELLQYYVVRSAGAGGMGGGHYRWRFKTWTKKA